MTVRTIKSYEEVMTLIESGNPVVIDFWATWCAPCKVISPAFEQLSNIDQFATIEFWKCDVDTQKTVAAEVGIRAMPTFIFFKNGKKVEELVGANSQGLRTLVAEATASATV